MARAQDGRLQELRALHTELAEPTISMGSMQRILRVLVAEAVQVRETLKKSDPEGGKEVDSGTF